MSAVSAEVIKATITAAFKICILGSKCSGCLWGKHFAYWAISPALKIHGFRQGHHVSSLHKDWLMMGGHIDDKECVTGTLQSPVYFCPVLFRASLWSKRQKHLFQYWLRWRMIPFREWTRWASIENCAADILLEEGCLSFLYYIFISLVFCFLALYIAWCTWGLLVPFIRPEGSLWY